MNTTDDSFPILVRKDSYAPGLLPSTLLEANKDYCSAAYTIPASSAFGGYSARSPATSTHTPRGLIDDMENARSRTLPDMSVGQKHMGMPGRTVADGRLDVIGSHAQSTATPELNHRQFPLMPSSMGRASSMQMPHNSSAMQTSAGTAGHYQSYALSQAMYHPNYSTYAPYASASHHDPHRLPNPYNASVRAHNNNKRPAEDINRYADLALDTLIGDIYSLCKDQHGCRYLQKKLDERNPNNVEIIFAETYIHASELMIGRFMIAYTSTTLTSTRSLWKLLVPETS